MRQGGGQKVHSNESESFVGPIRARLDFRDHDFTGRRMGDRYVVTMMEKAVWMVYFDKYDLWVLGNWLTEWVPLLTGRIYLVRDNRDVALTALAEKGEPELLKLRILGELK